MDQDEAQKHRGDSKRNRADPPLHQHVPHPYPRIAFGAASNGNVRPLTHAQESMVIAARIVRTTVKAR